MALLTKNAAGMLGFSVHPAARFHAPGGGLSFCKGVIEVVKQELSEPRAALRQAIAGRDALAQGVEGLRATIERLHDERVDAGARLAEAKANEADLAEVDRREIIEGLARGDTAVLDRPARRSEVGAAEVAVEAYVDAIRQTERQLREAETSVGFAERKVAAAVGDVISAESIAGLAHSIEEAKATLAQRQAVARFLRGFAQDPRLDAALRPVEALPLSAPILDRWRRAVEALGADPEARLL
jgi:hypothetical protein